MTWITPSTGDRPTSTRATPSGSPPSARRALLVVGIVEVLALATWFSATAVVPSLREAWGLSTAGAAWLASAVPGGFVAGSLLSATLNLADRIEPRFLMATSALGAGLANLGILAAGDLLPALPLRFLTGAFLAGVYPPGMKLVATHFRRGRGLAIGVVIGALTLGSASPHLVRGVGDISWEGVVVVTSLCALAAAALIIRVREGPHGTLSPPLDVGYALRAMRHRPLRLATLGYLGHMWELYAVWAWLPAFVAASTAAAGAPAGRFTTGALVFAAIGLAGLAGAIGGGRLADRYGRTALTSAAMLLSGACALLSMVAFSAPLWLLVLLLAVWGAAVIADSAQFSTAVTELAEPRYAGSVLTLQTALGFLLTIATIRLVPIVADAAGWRYSLAPLAIGPALGTIAMLRLRGLPEAVRMAGGAR